MKPRLFFVLGAAAFVALGAGGDARADVRCNCVEYARTKVPALPRGLFTREDKLRVINSHAPTVGAVAVHNYAGTGHVSVVTRVWTVRVPVGGGRYRYVTYVKIIEANYKRCAITQRVGTPAALGIVGYFRARR